MGSHRRCGGARSLPSNIAEGHGRSTRKAYLRYLEIAIGSVYELQTQLIIARNLEFIDTATFTGLEDRSRELERMLSA